MAAMADMAADLAHQPGGLSKLSSSRAYLGSRLLRERPANRHVLQRQKQREAA